jgi:uncharacterized membrane protein
LVFTPLVIWLVVRSVRTEKQLADMDQSLRAAEDRLRDAQRSSSLLEKRLADLTRKVEAGEERWQETAAAPAARPEVATTTRVAQPEPPPIVTPSPVPVPAASVSQPAVLPAATRTMEPPAPPLPAAQALGEMAPMPVLTRWLLGGNTIVKVGIGILFIGLAFLAKFASEHVRVPIEVRLTLIGSAALVLLAIGWRLREKRAGYAQVLQGGAVAVLYLTLFVAFRFYGVLAVGPVFGLMVMVGALAAALAVLQDAPALAVIGALGGFATPLLVSTGTGSHVALFSYYLVIDLGIAAVAWHKTWKPLNLVGFLFTFVVGTTWGVLQYDAAHYASCQAFLAVFFLVFVAIMLMPARRPLTGVLARRTDAWVNGTLLFGLPTITFALQYGLVRHMSYGAAMSALAMAGFYVLLAAWMRSRLRVAAVVFEGSLAIGSVFVTLAIPFALDARSTAGAWALEGAALVWLGFRQTRPLGRLLGYALLLLSGSLLLRPDVSGIGSANVFNATLLNALLLAASSLVGAWLVRRFTAEAEASSWLDAEKAAEPMLIGWATLWLGLAASVEINRFVSPGFELAAWLACLSVLALVFTSLSVWLRWRLVAMPAIAFAPLLLLYALAGMALGWNPATAGGWWAWPLALATHLVVLGLAAPYWPARARQAAHLLGVLVLAALGASEGREITSHWGDFRSAWPWLGWLAVPAALLLLLPRAATARVWPVRAAVRTYQTAAAGVLTFCALSWALVANIVSDGSASPLPYVPLLNPLDLGVGIALFAAWRWRESDGGRRAPEWTAGVVFAALAGNGFVWLNAILIRAFHHGLGVPFRFDAWMASLAVQTGISLLWTATALALMWGATRRAARVPWMAGAALLGAVVVKLLIVDLSGSGTVTRIVSFIGVGVLMLVIGYVAPLPGREGRDEAS